MKRIFTILAIIALLTVAGFSFSYAGEITTEPPPPIQDNLPDPEPPIKDVSEEKLIKPGKGVAGVNFGMDLKGVENVFGRGDIRPMDTDFQGNSTLSLTYEDKKMLFKFFNGSLFMIIIKNKDFATKTGVHVMGNIGDAIREFGSDFRQDKSLVQDPDFDKQAYVIYYDKDNIAFKCVGKLITEIHLKTPHKIKPKKH